MRIAHLADLHLGFRAYHRQTDQGVNRREADVFACFREALEHIAKLQVDLVLMAGDIFHVPRPSNYAIVQAQRELLRFRNNCSAPIVMIAGNHESVRSTDNRCILEVLEVIPDVKAVSQKTQELTIGENVRLVCIPHNDLPQIGDYHIAPSAEFAYNLLMVHGTVDSDRINDYGGYDVPRSLVEMAWDYVACGHFHSFTHLGGHAYYAGAIERTSNNIWQEAAEPKGFVEFNLATHSATFHALSKPRPTVDLPVIDAQQLSSERLNQLILDQAEQVDITDKVVRQKIVNIPKTVQKLLDYRTIRQLQARALHYLLDLRSPEQQALQEMGISAPQGGLAHAAREFLASYRLPAGIDREQFMQCGVDFLSLSTGDLQGDQARALQ